MKPRSLSTPPVSRFPETFTRTRDLPRAVEFYEGIMGFTLDVDQGWSKILRIRDGAYVGLVDGDLLATHNPHHGILRASVAKRMGLSDQVLFKGYVHNTERHYSIQRVSYGMET